MLISLFCFYPFRFSPVSRSTSLELNCKLRNKRIHVSISHVPPLQSLYFPSNKITYSIRNRHISNSCVSLFVRVLFSFGMKWRIKNYSAPNEKTAMNFIRVSNFFSFLFFFFFPSCVPRFNLFVSLSNRMESPCMGAA